PGRRQRAESAGRRLLPAPGLRRDRSLAPGWRWEALPNPAYGTQLNRPGRHDTFQCPLEFDPAGCRGEADAYGIPRVGLDREHLGRYHLDAMLSTGLGQPRWHCTIEPQMWRHRPA